MDTTKIGIVAQLVDEQLASVHTKEVTDRLLNSPVFVSFCKSPASYKKEYIACYPGGLLDLSLKTFQNLYYMLCEIKHNDRTLAETYYIPDSSIVLCGLFFNLGKAGCYECGEFKEYYIGSGGTEYGVNNDLTNMSIQARSVLLLNEFGFRLNSMEYQAFLNDKFIDDYKNILGTYVRFAHRMAIDQLKQEKK